VSRKPQLSIEAHGRAVAIVRGRVMLRETGSRPGRYERPCADVLALLDEHSCTLTLWFTTDLGEQRFSLPLKRGTEMDRARRIVAKLGRGPKPAPPRAPDIVGNDGGTRVIAGVEHDGAPPARPPSAPPAPPTAARPAAKPAPAPSGAKSAAPPAAKPASDRPVSVAPAAATPAPAGPEARPPAPLAPAPRPPEPEPEPPAPPPFAGIELPLPDEGEDWIVFDPLPGTLRLLARPRD